MAFPSKVALVTGASSGIGAALTARLIANGTFVIAVARRKDRLQTLLDAHGPDKVAAEPYDMTDLEGMPEWVNKLSPRPVPRAPGAAYPSNTRPSITILSHQKAHPQTNKATSRITTTYPTLDTIILNAGIQRSIDFTSPTSISLPNITSELTTNYLAPLHLITHFLPHLQSLKTTQPAAAAHIVLVSSGLALVPIPRCPNYCATKSALHSLAWTLRTQLAAHDASSHVRVIEVVPPAVQTELHSIQPDLVAAVQANFGLPLEEFTEETWTALEEGKEDEIIVGPAKNFAHVETDRKKMFDGMAEMFRSGSKI
ncbi:short-chain dehydrogenase oxidoreductase [Colletotrichum asianum]|uniref:Short-chain dehydrogenase oxidoreductase n=1 Tax=Colletotrichum asianum TaxID=702518 RepID=A0A8H3ZMZ9_9PEZI|nr:short-chain dehydrogenase oxidoreductase [Colletotrichum asianum]